MIKLKSPKQIDMMRRAGKITAAARALAGGMVQPGVTTREIDKAVHDFILSQGAIPTFLNYEGYPASICISINDEVIHGIPGKRKLMDGDVVSIDVGATKDGFVGDCAATFVAGKASKDAEKLITATQESFYEALKYARVGYRISDIGAAVQSYAEQRGFSVIRDYVGHGVGAEMHEDPEVPNFGKPGHGMRLLAGMTIAIEPMVAAGSCHVKTLHNGWTVVTRDGSLASHYENTILITDGEPEILTVTGE